MVEPNDKGDAIKDLTSELNDSQNKEVSCTKPVRGKSEVVKLTEEAMDESDDDEEVNSAKKNADDKFVRQLLSGAQDVKNNEEEAMDESDDDEEVNSAKKNADDKFVRQLLSGAQDVKNNEGNIQNKPKTTEEIEEEEFMRELAKKPLSYFSNMKELPDAIAKKYYKKRVFIYIAVALCYTKGTLICNQQEISRRWKESEKRIKETEELLMDIKYEDKSLEEDRLEILGELLDKASQSFEICDEHEHRRIPIGHRIVLETRLLTVFNNAIDIIYKIVGEFDKLKDDQVGVNDERDQLRYEIRYCDAVFTEVHERFLKSYLEMPW
uniref:KIF-binding protein n=1 Tax=Ascaris lumbricoides TaxID=6252 RepID=A0A0M3IKU4_ASCLU